MTKVFRSREGWLELARKEGEVMQDQEDDEDLLTPADNRRRLASQPKTCRMCQEVKTASEFFSAPRQRDGLHPYCRVCTSIHGTARRLRIPVPVLRAYLETHSGRCDICGGINPSNRRLHVDHCHATGVIRGLLCAACNTALGLMCDDRERIEAMVSYLKRAQSVVVPAFAVSTRLCLD